MKFVREEIAASKTSRYLFALGKQEAEILYGALLNAQHWTPRTTDTTVLRSRLSQMVRTTREALERWGSLGEIIIVNARSHIWKASSISYEELVALASPAFNPVAVYTVTYGRHRERSGGSLTKGESINIQDGLIFNVALTNNA